MEALARNASAFGGLACTIDLAALFTNTVPASISAVRAVLEAHCNEH